MFIRPIQSAVFSRRGRCRGGAAAVEFAVASLPMLIFIIAAVELSRAMMVLEFMSNAARDACRYAVVQPPPTNATRLQNIQAKAKAKLSLAMVYKATINVYYYTPSSPSYTPPANNSSWTAYPTSSSTGHPALAYYDITAFPPTTNVYNDYVRVNVVVNASDIGWLPSGMFLAANTQFSVSEDMAMEFAGPPSLPLP